jgi:hypothetical protein
VEIDAAGDNEIDWREIYSEWKDWLLADAARKGYPQMFRVVGGDPVSETENLGSTFFLMYPWKLRPAESDHRLVVNGNIFTDPAGFSPFVPTLGDYTVHIEGKVSTLVEQVSGGGGGVGLTPAETAAAVWEALASGYVDPLTMGGKILTDLATIISAGGSLSPEQDTQLIEIWQILGLDVSHPLTVYSTARVAGTAITQAIEENVPVAGAVRITKT